jgi:hypothetical protein
MRSPHTPSPLRRTSVIQVLSFGLSLVDALTNPYSLTRTRELLQERTKNRTTNFLSLCQSKIYSGPNNPYRGLLHSAGFTWERLENEVLLNGLEATLSKLAGDGIYLDIDEFKGKKPIIRKRLTMQLNASDLDMVSGPSVPLQSSGSRGPRMQTPIDVEGIKFLSSYIPLIADVLQAKNLPVILYYPMPSVPGIIHLITFALGGLAPSAWFSQTPVLPLWRSAVGIKLRILLLAARLRGVSLPAPKFSDIRHPVPLARWIKTNCPDGSLIATFPGSALRLIQVSQMTRINLPPIVFILGGEPITPLKRKILEENGHRVFPWFSTVEAGRIALGCMNPKMPDDMHILEDRFVAVINERFIESIQKKQSSLLFTSLLPDAHKLFLNVETGDSGILEKRTCRCPWETLGLRTHLFSVQSFEKLTLEGMTYMSDALSSLVDDILPSMFGGTPADYQFSEEEGEDGLTRLVVSVNPVIEANEISLHDVVMEAIRASTPIITPMADLLSRASSVIVCRRHPRLTASGKILNLIAKTKSS